MNELTDAERAIVRAAIQVSAQAAGGSPLDRQKVAAICQQLIDWSSEIANARGGDPCG